MLSAFRLDENLPSQVKRSSGVGQIVLIGHNCEKEDIVKASPEKLSREVAVLSEWRAMLAEEGRVIDYDTFRSLVRGHEIVSPMQGSFRRRSTN